MHNLVLSPIDPEKLISSIAERVTESVLKAIKPDSTTPKYQGKTHLNVAQAADYLDLAIPTIYSKSSIGELPSSKVGKRLYFSVEDLDTYLKSGRRKTNSEIEEEAKDYLKRKGGVRL